MLINGEKMLNVDWRSISMFVLSQEGEKKPSKFQKTVDIKKRLGECGYWQTKYFTGFSKIPSAVSSKVIKASDTANRDESAHQQSDSVIMTQSNEGACSYGKHRMMKGLTTENCGRMGGNFFLHHLCQNEFDKYGLL